MIFIAAGHSNSDPGAVANGKREADLAKEYRDLLVSELISQSKGVVISQDNDNETLSQTIQRFNKLARESKQIDIYMSIHFNSASSSVRGTEIFIPERHTVDERLIGKMLVMTASDIMDIRNRGVKVPSQSARGKLYIEQLLDVNLLFEVCFITNKWDIQAYDENKHELAKAQAKILISEHARLNGLK